MEAHELSVNTSEVTSVTSFQEVTIVADGKVSLDRSTQGESIRSESGNHTYKDLTTASASENIQNEVQEEKDVSDSNYRNKDEIKKPECGVVDINVKLMESETASGASSEKASGSWVDHPKVDLSGGQVPVEDRERKMLKPDIGQTHIPVISVTVGGKETKMQKQEPERARVAATRLPAKNEEAKTRNPKSGLIQNSITHQLQQPPRGPFISQDEKIKELKITNKNLGAEHTEYKKTLENLKQTKASMQQKVRELRMEID